ncbi:kxDL motif-containing protein CG10681 isoform X1 [Schistocerca serialis cubense]|uniref:kxDL motif-containing protein CG10681 isoform X1 n=1 Tax=Schistocerca serialis cubense TaxID=2023355 RepID=UPI00214EBCF7|nr:kxDL motif-containing protein CG10681 isoform X1 [Schistocerca serialis cubense]
MAENTPESDLGSIECFQNYTAPEVFIQGLAGIVDQQDVEAMIRAQKQMLQRFEKTNEMLTNCNALSVTRLKSAGSEFKKHTQLLLEMKKDLDNIFKRIRILKTKLSAQYPQAFAAAAEQQTAQNQNINKSTYLKDPEHLPDVGSLSEPGDTCSSSLADHDDDEDGETHRRERIRRGNSSSTDSANGNSNNDTSPCTSDTG